MQEVHVLIRQRTRSAFLLSAFLVGVAATSANAEQTIVFMRHGEKPSSGLGQLTCQGLNRALALPSVLTSRFGMPDYLYAPNPEQKISDPSGSYYYVRPLATIEPTAIRAARSVNSHYGYTNISGLESVLIRSSKADTTIFVVWEHDYLVKIVQDLMNKYGGGAAVPAWTTGDYDSLYILHVNYAGGVITARFTRETEGLNGQPTSCPAF
jgi:hypothetical protein